MKSGGLLDPKFKYVDSTHTDIRVTFDRVRKELEAQKRQEKPPMKPTLRLMTQTEKLGE